MTDEMNEGMEIGVGGPKPPNRQMTSDDRMRVRGERIDFARKKRDANARECVCVRVRGRKRENVTSWRASGRFVVKFGPEVGK